MAYNPNNPNGQATSANSAPVVIASDQSPVPTAVSSLPLPSGAATESTLSALNTKIPASPSQEHTIASSPNAARLSDGSAFYKATTPSDTQPISAVALPLPTGAATSAAQTTGNNSLSSIDSKVPALGQALAAASVPVVLTAAQVTTLTPPTTVTANIGTTNGLALETTQTANGVLLGAVAETAPASDTASSGLNGRLQRIAQRITSLISLFPTSLGQGTMATSMKVVLPSDQSAIPASQSGTWNVNNVSGTVSLPTGAATSAAQTTGNNSLSSIDGKIPSNLTVQNTEPSSAAQGLVVRQLKDSNKKTYSAASGAFSSALLATDIFRISGSATTTVKVRRIGISATQTTAGDFNLLVIKRSTANTGGTSTTLTNVPHDSADAAATNTVLSYTANPTAVGTTVGSIRSIKFLAPTTTGLVQGDFVFDFSGDNQKGIVLNGIAEGLTINLNTTTVTGGSFQIWVEWTEE